MKKNLYRIGLSNRLNGQWSRISLKLLGLVLVSFLMAANPLMAQTWTGTESNNFTLDNNWDPAGGIDNKALTIPLRADYTNVPELTGSTSYTVNNIEVTWDADTSLVGQYIVSLDPEASLTVAAGSGIDYNTTGIIVNSGNVYYQGYLRFDQIGTYMIVNGGYVELSRYLIMNNNGNTATGGQVIVNGGTVRLNGGFHGRVSKNLNQWIITGDGKLEVSGNYGSVAEDIESGWISGGDDYSIVRTYDAIANLTTYSAVTNAAFIISNADRQVLIAGIEGTPINLLQTTRVMNAQSLTWKYRLQGEDTYQAFSPAETGVSLTPNFTSSGTYFVRAEGVDADGIDMQTQDVEIYVGTDKIDITPYFESQYARVDTVLYTLSAVVTGSYTGFEWKYATTPGGPYLSFDPLGDALNYDVEFGAEGNYYVVAEATIDGNFHRSAEMLYIVEGASASRNIQWTGAFSTDAHYAANYSPVAPFFKSHVSYRSVTERDAIIGGAVNDTVASLYVGDANLIINRAEESVFNVRGSGTYLEGKLMIQSGIVDFSAEYVHIPDNADTVIVSGNSVMKTRNLLMGNKALSTGGALFIEDNASVYIRYLDRVSTAKDSVSRVWLSDKGVLYMEGNQMNRGGDLIETGKINCPDEFFEPYMLYDKSIDYTFIRAIDTRSFAIEDAKKQYAGAGDAVATPLTLINGDGLTTFSWYWSSSPTGPWTMIEGTTDTPSFAPSFDESGTYFVIAIGSDGTEEMETTNVATIEVVGLTITPDELEMLPGQGGEMNYVLSEGTTLVSRNWYDLTDENNPIILSTDSTFIPDFTELGVYTIGFQAEVKDEYDNNYFLSAIATVTVVDQLSSIGDVKKARVSVFPNPSTGTFSVDAEGVYSVEVYDLTGTLVLRQDASQGQKPITLAQKGVFLVKVIAGKDIQVTRVVIK